MSEQNPDDDSRPLRSLNEQLDLRGENGERVQINIDQLSPRSRIEALTRLPTYMLSPPGAPLGVPDTAPPVAAGQRSSSMPEASHQAPARSTHDPLQRTMYASVDESAEHVQSRAVPGPTPAPSGGRRVHDCPATSTTSKMMKLPQNDTYRQSAYNMYGYSNMPASGMAHFASHTAASQSAYGPVRTLLSAADPSLSGQSSQRTPQPPSNLLQPVAATSQRMPPPPPPPPAQLATQPFNVTMSHNFTPAAALDIANPMVPLQLPGGDDRAQAIADSQLWIGKIMNVGD